MAPNDKPTPLIEAHNELETELDIIRRTFVSDPIMLADGRQVVFHAGGLTATQVAAIDPVLSKDVNERRVFIEPESMIRYIKTFKQAGAVIFAYPYSQIQDGPCFYAHLNYHEGGTSTVAPGVRTDRHRAVLKTPFDVDYQAWRPFLHDDKTIKQADFAIFIEDMAHTILEPDAGHLQEIVLDLQMLKNVAFKQQINLRNGTSKFTYEEVEEGHSSGKQGDIVLPNSIELRLSVYQGGEPITISAKLRYQLERGVLFFKIVAPGIERIERDEFRLIGAQLRDETETPVLYSE
jgi:uncharacterized protein YfdQ (DUF2303 family)